MKAASIEMMERLQLGLSGKIYCKVRKVLESIQEASATCSKTADSEGDLFAASSEDCNFTSAERYTPFKRRANLDLHDLN